MSYLLGEKGANIAEITNLNLSVPSGFTITTDACNEYYQNDKKISLKLEKQIEDYLLKLEEITGKKYGNMENLLFISVRNSCKSVIPGLSKSILNLGLTEEIIDFFEKQGEDCKWLWESYANFILNYSKLVKGINVQMETNILNNKNSNVDALRKLTIQMKKDYKRQTSEEFPEHIKIQLFEIIKAMFNSWESQKASLYRHDMDIPFNMGMAIDIQTMVFGNKDYNSGTGIIYTRNPYNGENNLELIFFRKMQGNNYDLKEVYPLSDLEFSSIFPEIFIELKNICNLLEKHYNDMQEIEFVIEQGKLYILGTRKGRRTPFAALKIACDLLDEKRDSCDKQESKILKKL